MGSPRIDVCKAGLHAMAGHNLLQDSRGDRRCRACWQAARAKRRQEGRNSSPPPAAPAPPYVSEHAHFARHCYPTRAEPEAPIPPLVLFGPWSPPALGER